MHTFTSLDNIGQEAPENSVNQITQPTPGGVKVLVFKYGQDIDELEDGARDEALNFMTSCIPPVQTMRQYLTEVPGRRLSGWRGMDGSTLRLLNWIVSSNRSHIVQDSPVPGSSTTEEQTQNGNLVCGMKHNWMQFRFAQGSPEKELIFFNELQKIPRSQNGKNYPTLFAWHGSPLSNWHSIIRTGLDFSNTLHGRAYGNGVYLARDFETSRGYSNRDTGKGWPSSALNVASAISLCEIANNPAQFVSTDPFFVVNRIDWIQCRYLFVQVQARQPESAAPLSYEGPFPNKVQDSEYVEQDPAYQLTSGSQQRIHIPLNAIPKSRRRAFRQGQRNDTGSSIDHPIVLDDSDSNGSANLDDSTSMENPETSDDIDVLLASDDEGDDLQFTGTRKRRRTSIDSGLGETQRGPDDVTPFKPGQLDIDSLPKLSEPTWASSSPAALRALNGQIKDLQKTQSKTNLASLGWYIDFDKLDNLFHWFVELHSFDTDLPLAKDMASHGCSSIVLELRFGASFPISPPFVRVVRPRFLPFAQGGGGHVTIGGAICSKLLTNSGWSPALSLEKVFLEVRMNLCEKDPPARLRRANGYSGISSSRNMDYSMFEAVDAYRRAASSHGWQVPSDLQMLQSMSNVTED
jgi:ubiquitin-conjugating enzyme E2 Q